MMEVAAIAAGASKQGSNRKSGDNLESWNGGTTRAEPPLVNQTGEREPFNAAADFV
jgi:hypothetical protein